MSKLQKILKGPFCRLFVSIFTFIQEIFARLNALIVSFTAVFRLVTQRSSPVFWEERCVTSPKTAAKETIAFGKPVPNLPEIMHVGTTGQNDSIALHLYTS